MEENRSTGLQSRIPTSTKSLSPARNGIKEFDSHIPPPSVKTNLSSRILKPRASLSTLINEANLIKPTKLPSKMAPPASAGKTSLPAIKTRAPASSGRPNASRPVGNSVYKRSVSASSHLQKPASIPPTSRSSMDETKSFSDESMTTYSDERTEPSPITDNSTEARLRSIELAYSTLSEKVLQTSTQSPDVKDFFSQRTQMLEESLQNERSRSLSLQNDYSTLLREVAEHEANQIYSKKQMETLKEVFEGTEREHHRQIEDMEMNHARVMENESYIYQQKQQERELLYTEERNNLQLQSKQRMEEVENHYEQLMKGVSAEHEAVIKTITEEKDAFIKKVQEGASLALKKTTEKHEATIHELEIKIKPLEESRDNFASQLEQTQSSLKLQKDTSTSLQVSLDERSAALLKSESMNRSLESTIVELEGKNQSLQSRLSEVESLLDASNSDKQTLINKLLKEESVRRKLHNTIQELKGNIRVFCRVRPCMGEEKPAEISYPDQGEDANEIEVLTEGTGSSLNGNSLKKYPFKFDRVFAPDINNEEIFDEISQLIQSAMDGYNVCIFAYGQTGSGKTYTMSSPTGMIPCAVQMIYNRAFGLRERGWEYRMEGQFLEIYNESIKDLLVSNSNDDGDKRRYEIYHDAKEGKTFVTNLTREPLESSEQVSWLLEQSAKNRFVAATNANEHSSRSHSVFMLHIQGINHLTGERCHSTLNLIDLAGSERLSHSQSTGDRLKETQAINKSLSCLGDVIHALGSEKEGTYVPYRNSKLTNLLQHSLGGNSKTLMFVNVSPVQQHVSETLCSLRFATKVNNTHIGTARRVMK
ncbi:kinesin-14 family minus-end directed microtubule motor Klp2 [Schizosaccharomyces osmophilus]|uniref:Kinesin-like protein n=1 Tax=Schizosaccharomyces osmophilus TaxID=2545709 RepID=A0AAE9WB94_9SCHI|nr:kinesin-14 family minus-end directed microtubule motor Klp2 [Schizosaccharomyces osmophilus]WBW72261.1 kinesin-14 family minus-end directed microtubule motor Klp2 [Schizosaccharomyces osmophilus]